MDNLELARKYIAFFHSCDFRKKDVDLSKMGMRYLLLYLRENKGKEITAGDLAKELEVSTARVAVLLSKSEAKGYIEKEKSILDARKTIVRITELGDENVKKHLELGTIKMVKLIEYVGKDEMEAFFSTILKMKDFLKKVEK